MQEHELWTILASLNSENDGDLTKNLQLVDHYK
jgi:hypothetical protein